MTMSKTIIRIVEPAGWIRLDSQKDWEAYVSRKLSEGIRILNTPNEFPCLAICRQFLSESTTEFLYLYLPKQQSHGRRKIAKVGK